MMRNTINTLLFIVVATLLLSHCGGGGGGGSSAVNTTNTVALRDRLSLEVTNSLLNPSYQALLQTTQSMNSQIQQACSNTTSIDNTVVVSIRDHWKQVMSIWAQTQLIIFPPLSNDLQQFSIHNWPNVRQNRLDTLLEELLVNSSVSVSTISANLSLQGLPAIEWLLYELAGSTDIITAFQRSDQYRCDVLTSVSNVLLERVQLVNQQWFDGAENFANPDGVIGLYNNSIETVELVINGIFHAFEKIHRFKLVEPLGVSIDTADDRGLEAFRSEYSLVMLQENLNFLKRIFDGDNTFGINDYLIANGQSAFANSFSEQLDSIITKAQLPYTLEGNLNDVNNRVEIEDLSLAIDELKDLMQLQLFSTLGVVQSAFNENDGD